MDVPLTPTNDRAIFLPSKSGVDRIDQPEKTSYLVIGQDEGQKEADYVNYQANNSQNWSKYVQRTDECRLLSKPDSLSNSAALTVSPSVSSFSTVSSVPPPNMEAKCPRSLHDSTISRLIDAVSLDDDTCGSISALIGQLDITTTTDQKDLTLSSNRTFSIHYQTTSSLKSPFKTTSTPNDSDRSNHLSYPTTLSCNTAIMPHQKNLSSPETADLEEVYTILDEEVLSLAPLSNLNQQTVRGNTLSQSFGSSPAKALSNWNSKFIDDTEESIYEEVLDPPERIAPKTTPRVNPPFSPTLENCYNFPTQNGFKEVELNVDEDPLDRIMATPQYGSPWKDLKSPTKRHAIYQNNESPTNYYDPIKSYNERQQTFINKSNLSSSQCPSPINKLPFRHPTRNHAQNTSRLYTSSPLHQNSCQINSDSYSKDFNRNYAQNREGNYNANQIRNMSNHKEIWHKHNIEESSLSFQSSPNSSENVNRQFTAPLNNSRPTASSPFGNTEKTQNHIRFNCASPPAESTPVHNPCLSSGTNQRSICSIKQFPEARYSLQTSLELPLAQSSHTESTAAGQAKSKSLGDLTSEDISCDFKGKYHIISRSFVSSKQNRTGSTSVCHLQTQSCDPLTEQLRKLVSLEGEDGSRKRSESPNSQQTNSPSFHGATSSVNIDDSPPLLTRRLSSRSQSRVRNINNRARERQQEASRVRVGELQSGSGMSIGGVVLRNKSPTMKPPANRHSTGSYIAGYISQMEDRGLPEGACTSLRYGNDHHRDRFYTDDTLISPSSAQSVSEPEVYFLLRL